MLAALLSRWRSTPWGLRAKGPNWKLEAVPTTTMRAWRLMRRITASEIKPLVLSKIDIDALVGGLRERLFKAWRLIVDRMLERQTHSGKGQLSRARPLCRQRCIQRAAAS